MNAVVTCNWSTTGVACRKWVAGNVQQYTAELPAPRYVPLALRRAQRPPTHSPRIGIPSQASTDRPCLLDAPWEEINRYTGGRVPFVQKIAVSLLRHTIYSGLRGSIEGVASGISAEGDAWDAHVIDMLLAGCAVTLDRHRLAQQAREALYARRCLVPGERDIEDWAVAWLHPSPYAFGLAVVRIVPPAALTNT